MTEIIAIVGIVAILGIVWLFLRSDLENEFERKTLNVMENNSELEGKLRKTENRFVRAEGMKVKAQRRLDMLTANASERMEWVMNALYIEKLRGLLSHQTGLAKSDLHVWNFERGVLESRELRQLRPSSEILDLVAVTPFAIRDLWVGYCGDSPSGSDIAEMHAKQNNNMAVLATDLACFHGEIKGTPKDQPDRLALAALERYAQKLTQCPVRIRRAGRGYAVSIGRPTQPEGHYSTPVPLSPIQSFMLSALHRALTSIFEEVRTTPGNVIFWHHLDFFAYVESQMRQFAPPKSLTIFVNDKKVPFTWDLLDKCYEQFTAHPFTYYGYGWEDDDKDDEHDTGKYGLSIFTHIRSFVKDDSSEASEAATPTPTPTPTPEPTLTPEAVVT